MGRSAHSLSTTNAPTHHIFIVLLPVVVSNGAPFIVMKYVNVAFTWVGTTFKDQPGSCMITLYVNIQILKGIVGANLVISIFIDLLGHSLLPPTVWAMK